MEKNCNHVLLFLSLLAVVAVSGCISSLGFGGGETTVEASNDVMVFSDSTVIPNPPILTGDTFTTSFNIKNLDEFEDAKNAKLQLYDWGVCAPSSCNPSAWETIDSKNLKTSYSATFSDISPKDVQNVECQFKSPASEKIGGMDAKCPVRYKLTYDFSGITTTELNVISNKKFQEMQRAGQVPSFTSTQSKSRGPIKVDFSFGVNQPARTSTIDANPAKSNIVKIPMYVTVENKGSGKIPSEEKYKITKLVVNGKDYNNVGVGDEFETISGNIAKIKSITKNSAASEGSAVFLIYNNNKEKISEFSLSPGIANTKYFVNLNGQIVLSASIDLTVKIPAALTSSGAIDKCSEITCDGFFTGSADGTDSCKLTLTKKIEFVKGKSQVFRCELISPSDNVVTDTKTFSIQSEVKYAYQLDNDFSVAIKPMTIG